jgi:hypothetical protein
VEERIVISRRITKQRTGRRFITGIAALGLIAGSMLASGTALAVHDAGFFELDGNATNNPAITGDDWDNVCHQVLGGDCSTSNNTTGAIAVSWVEELDTSATIFTGGGSKDPIDISSWAWKNAGGLPDKDNLLHSFAARYRAAPSATCPAGTASVCDILYFGSDRYDNSGDAQQGFWFFQNRITLGNVKSGGGFNFDGVHRNGDLLIISDFSNGGTVSTISVYKWNTAVSGNLELLLSSDNANCATVGPADAACGLVNPSNGTTAPWPFTDKSGNSTYLQGELYEGGINLSTLGLSGECFASAASETRSSTSTTATLKDFVLGQFASCAGGVTTQASTNGTVLPGEQVRDTATVTITGATSPADAQGTVDFYLCGPDATPTACSAGGIDAGADKVLTDTSNPANTSDGISGTNSDYVNTASSPLTPGYYCFAAVADLTNYADPARATNTTTECFQVRATSSTTTTQNWLPQDSASVTVNGAALSGSVTFTLYDSADCTGTVLGTFTDNTAPFSTNNQTTVSVAVSNDVSWKAVFTPSDSGVQGSTSGCEVSSLTITN